MSGVRHVFRPVSRVFGTVTIKGGLCRVSMDPHTLAALLLGADRSAIDRISTALQMRIAAGETLTNP